MLQFCIIRYTPWLAEMCLFLITFSNKQWHVRWFTNDSVQCETEHDLVIVRMPQSDMCFPGGHLQKRQNAKLWSSPAEYLKMGLKGGRCIGSEHSDLYKSCSGKHTHKVLCRNILQTVQHKLRQQKINQYSSYKKCLRHGMLGFHFLLWQNSWKAFQILFCNA